MDRPLCRVLFPCEVRLLELLKSSKRDSIFPQHSQSHFTADIDLVLISRTFFQWNLCYVWRFLITDHAQSSVIYHADLKWKYNAFTKSSLQTIATLRFTRCMYKLAKPKKPITANRRRVLQSSLEPDCPRTSFSSLFFRSTIFSSNTLCFPLSSHDLATRRL